ncbi:hypothetical protein LTS10_004461 [Elasticomyces elasticus]|nr:hypothetical protein LTS10_004461 [Elasticomyces elasticus]
MQNESLRQVPLSRSRNPFTCGLTGTTYTHAELFARSESLARALADIHQWSPNEDTSWDKVVCIYSLNSIDCITAAYAAHRLSGIVTPANATYTVEELAHQLKTSGAKAVFTCSSLLATALQAADMTEIPRKNVYILDRLVRKQLIFNALIALFESWHQRQSSQLEVAATQRNCVLLS